MPGTPTRGRCHTEGGVASHWTRPQSSQVRDRTGGGAQLPIRQPPKGAGLHGARGRGSALDTPTRTPKWAGLKALTRGRGFTVNTCQRGGATERKGAWLRLLVPTKGRGYIAQGGVASWGRGRRWGVTSEGKAWLQGAWPYREGVASWGRGHKGGRGVGWGVASRGRGFKGAWLHGGGGVSGHAPSRPDPHLGSTDPIELVPAPWIWGEPPWPWI